MSDVQRRHQAVQLVQVGHRVADVAQQFGVSRQSVRRWVRAHREGGAAGLAAKPRGRPPGGVLSDQRQDDIAETLIRHLPDELDLPFTLWSPEAVGRLIDDQCGLTFSWKTVGRYLRRWGLKPANTLREPFDDPPEAERKWRAEWLRVARTRAKSQQACLLWFNAITWSPPTHPDADLDRLDECATTVFPDLVVAAINSRGGFDFMAVSDRLEPKMAVEFLGRLAEQHSRRIHLLTAEGQVFDDDGVQAWLKDNAGRVRCLRVPDQDPEEVWRQMRAELADGLLEDRSGAGLVARRRA